MSLARRIGQGLLDAAWHATRPGRQKSSPTPPRAAFTGAKVGRLTSSWTTTNTSIDADLWRALPALRARSRDLFQNNEYGRAFALAVRANVAGPRGFTLQNRARTADGKLDLRANDTIEQTWKRWRATRQCDVTRKLSGAEMDRLIAETVARDGEVLVRKVRGYDNRAGYALQLLEADRLDHDYDVGSYAATGNEIRMGVELDRWGAPVAYHIRSTHPGDYTYRSARGVHYERVPATEMLHLFIPLRPEQTRGVPWAHAAMTVLHHCGDYRESAVVAARVGAAQMGFFTTPDGLPPGADPTSAIPPGDSENGAMVQHVEPGEFRTLAEGQTFQPFNPDYPHEQFDAFTKSTLRGTAVAFGMSYHRLTGDLEGVNYSSARIGEMSERDMWRAVQSWLIGAFYEDVFEDWLTWQLATNRLPMSPADFNRLHQPTFVPRAWEWVDPLKEGQGHKLSVDERFTTRSRVILSRGDDPDEVWREAEAENEMLRERGLLPVTSTPAAPAPIDDSTDEDTGPPRPVSVDNVRRFA